MGVVQDHQAGEQHGVLQPLHRQRHEVVALPLVVQDQRQQGHHQHEDDGAADDGVGDAGVVHELVLRGHKHLPAAWFWETPEGREKERGYQVASLTCVEVSPRKGVQCSSSTMCSSRKVETTPVSTDWWIDKQNVTVHAMEYYQAIKTTDACYDTNEASKHYTKRNKPDTRDHILYDSIYMKGSGKANS